MLASLLATGCQITQYKPSAYEKEKMRPITIKYWRVWDGPDAFADVINKYRARHPNINIEYKKLRYDEYEQALLEAFATDQGPDIFSIHNTWMKKYQSKGLLKEMPEKITMVFPAVQGSVKKEVIYQAQSYKSPTVNQIKNDFADVVFDDVVIKALNDKNVLEEKIYGLPLAIDTLALYFNRDLFNNAGITAPPEYWNQEFQQTVKKLTKQNNKGQIIQSGVALGGSDNIERSTDILSVLMMQNGTVMMAGSQVQFHVQPAAFRNKNYTPGLEALRFYTDFSNPAKEVYSWNKELDNSLDLFVNNKLAMMFGYAYMLPEIRERGPKLNFSIAKLPQIEGNSNSINFANYWVEVVSNKSEVPEEAWDFLNYLSKKEQVASYLSKTQNATALRSLIDGQKEDPNIGLFADQILTSHSWYRGADANAAEKIIKEMIDDVIVGQSPIADIIETGAKKVQQTIAPSTSP